MKIYRLPSDALDAPQIGTQEISAQVGHRTDDDFSIRAAWDQYGFDRSKALPGNSVRSKGWRIYCSGIRCSASVWLVPFKKNSGPHALCVGSITS